MISKKRSWYDKTNQPDMRALLFFSESERVFDITINQFLRTTCFLSRLNFVFNAIRRRSCDGCRFC
jgi:hypothetical protein